MKTHGLAATYNVGGCRCGPCTDARTEEEARKKAAADVEVAIDRAAEAVAKDRPSLFDLMSEEGQLYQALKLAAFRRLSSRVNSRSKPVPDAVLNRLCENILKIELAHLQRVPPPAPPVEEEKVQEAPDVNSLPLERQRELLKVMEGGA